MCGRYASSRQPEDLVEEFEIHSPELPRIEADYNVAPTKEVYAVVERPPGGDKESEPERQLRVLTWGLVPSWAKDPSIGNRMINARMETVGEKPAFRRAFERRRAILPADGYYEWYPTEDLTKAEFDDWVAKHPDQKDAFTSLTTVIDSQSGGVLLANMLVTWLEGEPASLLVTEETVDEPEDQRDRRRAGGRRARPFPGPGAAALPTDSISWWSASKPA